MSNAVFGMAVHDDCKLKFGELKSKRIYRFIIFKIEDQQVVVEKLGSPEETYEDFTNSLPEEISLTCAEKLSKFSAIGFYKLLILNCEPNMIWEKKSEGKTLEEAFLNIGMQAELENATSEGKTLPLTLTSGSTIQIPVGARYVAIPRTETAQYPKGLMVEVHWEQDESGTLCISGQSPETPVPPNVNLPYPASESTVRLNKRGIVRGIPIDPQYIIQED